MGPYQVQPLRVRVDLEVMAKTGASLSDVLVSYQVFSFYPSIEIQSAYSTAPADWTNDFSNIDLVWNI